MEHLQSSLQIKFAQRSEAGRKKENQDTVGARIPDGNVLTTKGIAIAIADGVSSSLAAREASQTVISGSLPIITQHRIPGARNNLQFALYRR